MFKFILFYSILLSFNISNLCAQEEQIQYKIEVKEKLLYVLALDKKGNPVTDLKKEDFQLLVDGRPQGIETFSFISHVQGKIGAEKKKAITEKRDILDIIDKETVANKRFKLAVIPYRYRSHDQRNRVQRAIKHLIEQAIHPDDWIGVIELRADRIRTIQDFTNSKEKLHKKVDAYFKYETEKFKTLQAQYPVTLEEISQVPQLPMFKGITYVREGIDIIPGLAMIAEKMGALSGRKIVYAFNLPILFLGDKGYRAKYFFELVDKMLSYNTTIYYTELTSPHAAGPFDRFFDPSRAYFGPRFLLQYHTSKQAALRFLFESCNFALANETGGKYYCNISSPTYFIDNVDRINSSYYLISFPIKEQLEKKESHKIRLKCKRKEVKLYYSNKYYAPHELEEKKFAESYKRIQLYKYLFLDSEKQPAFSIVGQWIALPSMEKDLQFGALDFYLPPKLFQSLPRSYQLGCSYKDKQQEGIIFQDEIIFAASKKNTARASHGCVVRLLAKLPEGEKSLRMVAMDSENGEYGQANIDIHKQIGKPDISRIILGRLMGQGKFFEYRDDSEALFNLKKNLYNLLSIKDKIIIPSTDNIFQSGEEVAFCLIQKSSEFSKKDKNLKITAHFSPLDRNKATQNINKTIPLLLRSKKVQKGYLQYYGIIDTSKLTVGKYRIAINIMDENKNLIDALGTYFKIIE